MISANKEKKKRVSKKKKSSWRKHVNIQDVDNFLEEQRLEERLGEPLSSLQDHQLFTLHTDKEEIPLSVKQKKRLRLAAPPKCFAMLQPHTKVPDPIKKRNRVRTKEERMCPILRKQANQRKLNGMLKPKEMQSINDRKKYEEKRIQDQANKEINEDIWNAKGDLEECEWLEKNTKRHTLRGVGKLNKVVPRLKSTRNTVIPDVEIPHPGTSYNPSYKDHNELLQEIAEKETEIIKKEEHINRVTKDMFRKMPADKTENAWLIEMSQGLPDISTASNHNDDTENDDNNDKPYKSINAPVVNKKKTRQQRSKQKIQMILKQMKLLAKLEKKRTVDIHQLKSIKVQIENREKELEKLKEKREKVKSLNVGVTKQLSKIKYEEPDIEFNMGQDLTGNLRNMKKQGSLLTDRFRSFQKRNILEVTARHNRKKSKVKKYVKPGFKDDWKTTVAKANLVKMK